MTVVTGLERLLAGEGVDVTGCRVGLIANPTSVDRSLRHAVDLLAADSRVDLRLLFGPEHGLRGEAQDMIAVESARDARTGLEIQSLYGTSEGSLAPTADSLAQIDLLLFDIQDVGSRYYTYVWTLVAAMRACAQAGVRVAVLDRPNPVAGALVEGGEIESGYESFVGMCSIPNRHGFTVGELALWANDTQAIGADLVVVEMRDWQRAMAYGETGLPWVLPSPNMPTVATALVYPGMCLVEGTEMSEGRGTTRPFEIAGAPYVDGHLLAEALSDEKLPGVRFRPLSFMPTFQKHAGVICGGAQLHVTDQTRFRPYLTGVAFLRAVRRLWPDDFAWRTRPYEFVTDRPAIDLLTGSSRVRILIDTGAALAEIAETWRGAQDAFVAQRQKWMLYP